MGLALCLSFLLCMGCEKPASTSPSGKSGTSESGSGTKSAAANSSLKGTVTIEGSSTVEPISLKAQEEFKKKFSAVNISVSGTGTGNGFKALAKGECDVSDASRPIKSKELKMCQDAEVDFIEIPVAYDGLTIVVNKDNSFIESLTVDQLKKIFREDMAAKKWKDVDPAWPDTPIAIYAPGIASGTHDYFMEVVGDKENGMRSDDQTLKSEDDKVLVTGVSQDETAIGFFGYSYFEANKDELKAVPIVNPKTGEPVTPSIETIESGEYAPFSRPLLIYINTQSYEERAEVEEFVNFYIDNAAMLAKEARYVALPQSIYDAARENLDAGNVGTHFLDAAGEKRSGGLVSVFVPENIGEK